MLKIYSLIVSAFLTCAIFSCSNHSELIIEPISQEFNERFITGERLNTQYFSTKDVMQYYQISGFSNIKPQNLLAKLNQYANSHYRLNKMDSVNNLTILFYRKRMLVDYSDHLYESARDNENQTLEGYADDLIASIEYERLKTDRRKVKFTSYLHDPKGKQASLAQTDTITLQPSVQ